MNHPGRSTRSTTLPLKKITNWSVLLASTVLLKNLAKKIKRAFITLKLGSRNRWLARGSLFEYNRLGIRSVNCFVCKLAIAGSFVLWRGPPEPLSS